MGASSGLTVGGDTNGIPGTNSSMLNGSTTVVVDSNGNLYVTDIYNQRVQFFPNGISVATTIAGTTGKGMKQCQFNYLMYKSNHRISWKF